MDAPSTSNTENLNDRPEVLLAEPQKGILGCINGEQIAFAVMRMTATAKLIVPNSLLLQVLQADE
jgi:hypothetical protein